MTHEIDHNLALAKQALDSGDSIRAVRIAEDKIDDTKGEEENTAYLRAMAFALVYLAESLRPGPP